MEKCKSCGKKIKEGLVLCPSCESIIREAKEPQLTSEQIKQIAKQVKKKFYKTLILWIGILSAVYGLSLYQIWLRATDKMGNLLVQRINDEFELPKIRKTVNDVAKTTAKEMLTDEIQPEVIKFKAEIELNVKKIEKLVNLAQSQVNNLTSKIEESNKKLETINKELNEAVKVNKDLKEIAHFMLTFIKAQSDDSEAYEQLARWGNNEEYKSYPFREIAVNTYESIRRSYIERVMPALRTVIWKKGVDPKTFTYDDFKYYFKNMPPSFHADLVRLILENRNLSEEKKMELLVDVLSININNSLNAKYFAGNILAEKLGVSWQPFDYVPILKKWQETKNTIPTK